jgi:hypothetical protein
LGSFPPHFSHICGGFVNLIYFFNELAFCFIGSLYVFFTLSPFFCLYFVDFSPCFYYFYYYFSPCACLGLPCSCFSRSLRCSIRSFI